MVGLVMCCSDTEFYSAAEHAGCVLFMRLAVYYLGDWLCTV